MSHRICPACGDPLGDDHECLDDRNLRDASSNSAAKLDPYPKVACHFDHLFLGAGGYVTCSWVDCPDPGAAQRLIEQRRAIPNNEAEAGPGGELTMMGAPRPRPATPNREAEVALDALERTYCNLRRTVSRQPVRDLAETFAEAESVLTKAGRMP